METRGRGAQQRHRRVQDQIEGARFTISDIRFCQSDGPVGALPDREHGERVGARLQQTGIDDRLPDAVAAGYVEGVRLRNRRDHAVERHGQQRRRRAVRDGGGSR